MSTGTFAKIDDYAAVTVELASPETIRDWSYGEVKKPETINYRTYRAEKDGLFCERIFGPERDWECFCGKYKGMKHKGIICDRCGVKVTHSRERRKRMGHINLAAPVVHIWFFKAMPSRLGALLAMKTADLEKVIYFQEYVVTDPGDAAGDGIEHSQLVTEEQYRDLKERYGDSFKADMGADAIKELINQIDLQQLADELRTELKETGSKQRTKDIIKRLKLVEMLRNSPNRPEWVVLDVVPVIPPDLRPLVLLESGNFATSDLNDLYRRVINRNSRLRKLIDLHAPEVIIRNEKRMLQQAVDALFDNDRSKRPVLGSSNRPLKSLTDMIKGKQGRFRENLLGKRVDYSARSVIVVGPSLKLHQCGIPKKIALELFQPFIIRRLKDRGLVDTIKSAKKMLDRTDEEVWDILDKVIHEHPVLLNRAPTLHRMGIQAFEPVLIEGNAIQIHPLVCEAFNADFDGDQMAVHLPLSIEAQTEASLLMLSTNNIFSPADGNPIIKPSLDIVLGCYYLTHIIGGAEDEQKQMAFADWHEAFTAYDRKAIALHTPIQVRLDKGTQLLDEEGLSILDKPTRITTTVGRLMFNDALPVRPGMDDEEDADQQQTSRKKMPFVNITLDKKRISQIIALCHDLLGRGPTIELLDELKRMGFHWATLAGLTFSTSDLIVPDRKEKILKAAQKRVKRVEKNYRNGAITEIERYHNIIEHWTHATNELSEELMNKLSEDTREGRDYLNPIWAMFSSGARGSAMQIRQLAGMRGLMTKPSGAIIETPIRANFREGLPVLEYFSSTHGGRKGLADTALKTAESGYLTRKLADVAQNVVVREQDCGTVHGITKQVVYGVGGDEVEVPLRQLIKGRTSLEKVKDRRTGEIIVNEGEMITAEQAEQIENVAYDSLQVRSPMTCETPSGVCAKCYGMDLSTNELVEEGLAVGIIAAESIGEPGTQLTMRTFHIGGTAQRSLQEADIRAGQKSTVRFKNLHVVENKEGDTVVLNASGELVMEDKKGKSLRGHTIQIGTILHVTDGQEVARGDLLASWDPHMTPLLSERGGFIRYEDIVADETVREEVDASGAVRRQIISHKGDLHPQIIICDAEGEPLAIHAVPEKAYLQVEEGDEITAGTLLARIPREMSRSEDITAGLPRVTELFEARRPKDPSVMAEISGRVELGGTKRGKRVILVRDEAGSEHEHLAPPGKRILVNTGDSVTAGQRLIDGPPVPHDILRVSGPGVLQDYLLTEVQRVYRSQHETIDDKHIEIIIAQMLRKIRVAQDVGDTSFLPGSIVDKFDFRAENERIVAEGGRPSSAQDLLFGITKAALRSDSFISAASFQETTKVLTEAALGGKEDALNGLKENVILGHMVPAGTGFRSHLKLVTEAKSEIPPSSETDKKGGPAHAA